MHLCARPRWSGPRLITVLIAMALSGPAHAVPIVSNLAGTDGLNFAGTDLWAQRFTTDGHAYLLENIVMKVAMLLPPTGVQVQIWSDGVSSLSIPGAPIGDFDIPSLPSDFAETTFTPTSDITLDPSTAYWITSMHSSSSGGAFQFRGTESPATGPGVIDSGLLLSTTGGASWGAGSIQSMKLEVNGTIVPSPGTGTLLLLGSIVFGLAKRRSERP
jgi:hypothetical protein